MKKIRELLLSQEIYKRLRSVVTILVMVGISFISFKIGTLVAEDVSSPTDNSVKTIQTGVSAEGVKGAQSQLVIEPEPASTTYLTYIYEPDYSALINSLKRERYYLETYRDSYWYEAEKTKIEEEHNNRSQFLFKYYIDIINHYEFLISQCGDCSEAAVYKQKAQEAAGEFDMKRQSEDERYQKEVAALEVQWNSFQNRLQAVQKLIKQLEAGEEPDDAFWNLYYQFP